MTLYTTITSRIGRGTVCLWAALLLILASTAWPLTASANSLNELRKEHLRFFGQAPLETLEAFDVACKAGSEDACKKAQKARAGEYYRAKAGYSALKSACKSQDGTACMAKGLWEQYGIGTKVDLEDAQLSYDLSCRQGHLPGCFMSTRSKDGVAAKSASRASMLSLCGKGLQGACVAQADYTEPGDLQVSDRASGVIKPLVSACESDASLCQFAALFGPASQPSARPALDLLAQTAGPGTRSALTREIVDALASTRSGSSSAAGIAALIGAFEDAGSSLVTQDMIDAAAKVPEVLAVVISDDAAIDTVNEQGRVALLKAAKDGQASVIGQLLQRGVSPDVRNGDEIGYTPLQLAVLGQHSQAVTALLDAGANPSLPDLAGADPLMLAAKSGQADIVSQLLDAGADFARTDRSDRQMTALHKAASEGQLQAATLLVDAGASLGESDATGQTPLDYAISQQSRSMVELFVGQGALLKGPRPAQSRYLDNAIRSGDLGIVRKLLAGGADPNIRDGKGETPLFAAIRTENKSLAELLLDNGADGTVVNAEGVTPAMLYEDIEDKRRQREAEQAKAREAQLAAERQAEARRREQARRDAAKKKERNGFLGGLVGIAAGAVIGSELGMGTEQIGEFATTMGEIGIAVEKGTSESLMDAQRSVDGLGARLSATAPSTTTANTSPQSAGAPSGTSPSGDVASQSQAADDYANRMRELARRNGDPMAMALTDAALNAGQGIGQGLVDQRNFENELALRRAELAAAQRAVAQMEARQQAGQSGYVRNAEPTGSGRSTQIVGAPADAPNDDPYYKKRTLTMTMPEVSDCMVYGDPMHPQYGGTTCDTSRSGRNGDQPGRNNTGPNDGGMNSGGQANAGLTYPGPDSFQIDRGNSGTGPSGGGTGYGRTDGPSGTGTGYGSSGSANVGSDSGRSSGPDYIWMRTQTITVGLDSWFSQDMAVDLLKTRLANRLSEVCRSKYSGSNLERSTTRISNGSLDSKKRSDGSFEYKGRASGDGFCRVSRYNGGHAQIRDCPAGPKNKFCPERTQPTVGPDADFYVSGAPR